MDYIPREEDLMIDNKYLIISELGSGGFGRVYLSIKNNNENEKYAVKVSKLSDCKDLENEIKMLNTVLTYNKNNEDIKYIIKLIEHGEGPIKEDINKPIMQKKYMVLEYAPKRTLFDYIYDPNHIFNSEKNGGLREKFGKIIFSKILKGVKACHDAGICHLDLKLNNILLDEHYNPKIADFGISSLINENKKNGKVEVSKGTFGYAAPERLFYRPFNGIKADIFSLGVILFYIVTGNPTFQNPHDRLNDKAYKKIVQKQDILYWEIVKDDVGDVKEEFKNLYIKMIRFSASQRPKNIDEILNDPWMKLKDDEKYEDIEKELYEEFKRRDNIIESVKKNKNNINIENYYLQPQSGLRSLSEECYEYFNENIDLKIIDDNKLNIKDFIKLKGNLNPNKFMNSFGNKIVEYFNDCYVKESKNCYKYNFEFINEENEEEEIPEDLKEELKELGIENIDDYNNCLKENNLIIQAKLFQSIYGYYLITFLKKSGLIEDYYQKLEKIISIIKEII